MDFAESRSEYEAEGLRESDIADDPIEQFEKWMADAIDAGQPEPSAMVLSTVDGGGRPRGRNVLLRGVDSRGFVFYTNYGSTKARALDKNRIAALTFHWFNLHRQVLIEGSVERVSDEESVAYFARRPRGSQLGAWASAQSTPIDDREILLANLEEVTARFEGEDVPRPPFWGGYRVIPTMIEFWQGQPNRLHDRILYAAGNEDSWSTVRLSP